MGGSCNPVDGGCGLGLGAENGNGTYGPAYNGEFGVVFSFPLRSSAATTGFADAGIGAEPAFRLSNRLYTLSPVPPFRISSSALCFPASRSCASRSSSSLARCALSSRVRRSSESRALCLMLSSRARLMLLEIWDALEFVYSVIRFSVSTRSISFMRLYASGF